MYLEPLDIACYIYCPILQAKGRTDVITKPLTFTEEMIRKAFIEAERNVCLKDSVVAPKKLLSAWDRIWWPAVAKKRHISVQKADAISLIAAHKFTDYCKYDISGWMYPTAGVEAVSDIKIGQSVLRTKADIVKVNLEEDKRNTVLINLDRRGLTLRQAAIDPAIKATAYAFYSGRGETITHISIDLDMHQDKIKVLTSTFRPQTMEGIRKMLYHVECGIRYNVQHPNPYACKECKVCQDFT
jgi:hypothetical protein